MGGAGGDAFLGLANDHPLPLLRHHYQPGLNKLRRHTANTRAMYWGSRLFCLWEGGQAYKVDGRALGTEGRSQFGGAVPKDADPMGGAVAIDPVQNRALFYGIAQGPQASDLTLYEFGSNFRLVEPDGRRTFRVPGFLVVNDFCVTPKYAVFVAPNVNCNGVQFLVNKDPGKVLSLDKGGNVLLVPRAGRGSGAIRTIPIAPDHLSEANLQLINAHEEGDLIVMDVVRSDASNKKGGSSSATSSRWPWATTLEEYRDIASRKSLWRYTVDTRANAVSKQLLLDRHVAFATINPQRSAQPHEYLYMNVGGGRNPQDSASSYPPQGILRYEVSTGSVQEWMPEPYEFCGEPAFAPRAPKASPDSSAPADREDDGYLLSVLFNGRTKESELIILDASDVGRGPVCRIPLGFAVPHGFHGVYTRQTVPWSPDEILRRAKLHDKMESRDHYWNEVKSDFSGLGLRFDDMEEYFGDFFS
jgi:all-trans-8'-apo-beta-carotenal 15,15'-oxygenase